MLSASLCSACSRLRGGFFVMRTLIANLAERAKNTEFLICETVPEAFLEGFLHQARGWRPLSSGRNSLKLDDRANVVSFAVDPVFRRYTQEVVDADPIPSAFRREDRAYAHGGRYVRY